VDKQERGKMLIQGQKTATSRRKKNRESTIHGKEREGFNAAVRSHRVQKEAGKEQLERSHLTKPEEF